MLDLGYKCLTRMSGFLAKAVEDNPKDNLAVLGLNLFELYPGSLVWELIPNARFGFYDWKIVGGAKSDFEFGIRQKLLGNSEKKPAASKHQNVSGECNAMYSALSGKISPRPRVSAECGHYRI